MSNTDLSVIIPVTTALDALPTMLSCLERQRLPANQYEIIVVFTSASSETLEMVERFSEASPMKVRTLLDHKGTEVSSKNLGAQQAAGQWLLFLDQDLMAGASLLRMHVKMQSASSGQAIILGGVKPHAHLPRGALTRWFMREDKALASAEQPDNPLVWSSRHCSLPRSAFLENGGFSTEYQATRAADIAFAQRMKSWKMPLIGLPKAEALIWRAAGFQEERRRFFLEGYDLQRLTETLPALPIRQHFQLHCRRSRFWLDTLFVPFYERVCQSAMLDIRVQGQSCRRIFTYDRRCGAQAARRACPVDELQALLDAL